jgi:molybdate transport system substrate-binding protein
MALAVGQALPVWSASEQVQSHPPLRILSGGAAEALVHELSAEFKQQTGMDIRGTFSAVGAMRDQLLAGADCDVLILSQILIDELVQAGHAKADSVRPVGLIRTGLAVAKGHPKPVIQSESDLRQAFLQASAIYTSDPDRSTAGAHFKKILTRLGLLDAVGARWKTFSTGAKAMQAMAQEAIPGAIGGTQVTEIMFTPGVDLIGTLPKPFELSTTYTAAIPVKARSPQQAQTLIDLMTSPAKATLRGQVGFS